MNKHDIIETIAGECSYPKGTVAHVTEQVFAKIHGTLLQGEDVRIAGFGTFRRVETKARLCRNPATGGTIEVPAGHKIKFKPAPGLKG